MTVHITLQGQKNCHFQMGYLRNQREYANGKITLTVQKIPGRILESK
jgi:hypothetical protein